MGNAARVPIEEVAIDATGTIAVRPAMEASQGFDHIYRAAMGVRWLPQSHSLVPVEMKDQPPAWWFRQIVGAVRSEYGQLLELHAETKWTNVPSETRNAIESLRDPHAV